MEKFHKIGKNILMDQEEKMTVCSNKGGFPNINAVDIQICINRSYYRNIYIFCINNLGKQPDFEAAIVTDIYARFLFKGLKSFCSKSQI